MRVISDSTSGFGRSRVFGLVGVIFSALLVAMALNSLSVSAQSGDSGCAGQVSDGIDAAQAAFGRDCGQRYDDQKFHQCTWVADPQGWVCHEKSWSGVVSPSTTVPSNEVVNADSKPLVVPESDTNRDTATSRLHRTISKDPFVHVKGQDRHTKELARRVNQAVDIFHAEKDRANSLRRSYLSATEEPATPEARLHVASARDAAIDQLEIMQLALDEVVARLADFEECMSTNCGESAPKPSFGDYHTLTK